MNETTDTLKSLIVSAQRLGRVAAQSTGNNTSPAVWRTLSILESDGPLRLGELAAASRVAQPTMSKLIQGLAADEWIRRIADVEDARSWLIATTPKGRDALHGWLETVAKEASALFDDVSADEWKVLSQAAAIIGRGLDSKRVAA